MTLIALLCLLCVNTSEAAFNPLTSFKKLLNQDPKPESKSEPSPLVSPSSGSVVSSTEPDLDTDKAEVEAKDADAFYSSYPNFDDQYTIPDNDREQEHNEKSQLQDLSEPFTAAYSYSYNSNHPSRHHGFLKDDFVIAIEAHLTMDNVDSKYFTNPAHVTTFENKFLESAMQMNPTANTLGADRFTASITSHKATGNGRLEVDVTLFINEKNSKLTNSAEREKSDLVQKFKSVLEQNQFTAKLVQSFSDGDQAGGGGDGEFEERSFLQID